jgi:hypothetical protein
MARYNPLAPIPPRQQRAQAAGLVQTLVNSTLRSLDAQFNRELQGGSQAITGYTRQLQNRLAPMAGQTQQRYTDAQNQMGAIDSALAGQLNAAGQSGAAAALAGKGSAARQALVAQGSAASDNAAAQPFVAGLQGGNSLRGYTAQLASRRQTAIENLRSQSSTLYGQEVDQLRNLDYQRAVANLGFMGDQAKIGADVAKTRAGYRYKAQQGKQPNASLSKTYGYVVDSNGNPILGANGKRQPVAKSASAANAPAKAAAKRKQAFFSVRDKTFTEAKRLYKGTTQKTAATGLRPGGTATVQVPYSQAYNNLWSHYGTQLVNQYGYKRSAVDTMIRRALRTAGYAGPQQKRQAAAAGAAAATAAVGQLGL